MRQWTKLPAMRSASRRTPLARSVAGLAVAGVAVAVAGCAAGGGLPAASVPAAHASQLPAAGQAGPVPGVPGSPGAAPSAAVLAEPPPHPAAVVAAAPAHFRTIPPGARLPSGPRCAAWVRARPLAENKGANRHFNQVTGHGVGSQFFPGGDDPRANRLLAVRIDGDFTGTTAQILRWAACKWGIDESIVFAQAAVESWWLQTTEGDWYADAGACPPGHGLGADGKPGLCPQSYGILQNRYPYEQASWPGIGSSTAMNADTAYAIWRSCFDGYETWLNNVTRGQQYRAGDAWGCVGRWFAGRWYAGGAQQYVSRVKTYLSQRIWTQPDFQQP
jgi:hypothetical protein